MFDYVFKTYPIKKKSFFINSFGINSYCLNRLTNEVYCDLCWNTNCKNCNYSYLNSTFEHYIKYIKKYCI